MITPETPAFKFSDIQEWERFRKELLLSQHEFCDFLGIGYPAYRILLKESLSELSTKHFSTIRKLYALEYSIREKKIRMEHEFFCPHCGKSWANQAETKSPYQFWFKLPQMRENQKVNYAVVLAWRVSSRIES